MAKEEKINSKTIVYDIAPVPQVWGESVLKILNNIFLNINGVLSRLIPLHVNPFVNAGAIANTSLIIAIISGILLLFWYVPSVNYAYESLEAMKKSPLSAQLFRSIHRYSSDACILFGIIHGFQMFFSRRFAGARWLAWVTGMLIIGFIWVIGWLGYWLLWDVRAQEIATTSIRILDVLPIFSMPLTNNILADELVGTTIFFLVFFFHMILPLPMAVALYLHITRLNRGKLFANKNMTMWILITMSILSFAVPAYNIEKASMSIIPQNFTMDYWYMAPLFIFQRLSEGMVWLVFLVLGIVTFTFPWTLIKRKKEKEKTPANVDTSMCNACRTCARDCPYNAITMVPRTDGKKFDAQPEVKESLCVSCGICAGACKTGAIGLSWFENSAIRQKMQAWADEIKKDKKTKFVAFICGESAGGNFNVNEETGECQQLEGYKVLKVPCIGWLNMRLPEMLIKNGVEGVLIAGCNDGDCVNREGVEVTEKRLKGIYEPTLKLSDSEKEKIKYIKASGTKALLVKKEAMKFKEDFTQKQDQKPASKVVTLISYAVLYTLFTAGIYLLSDYGYTTPFEGKTELIVSLEHPGETSENCRQYTKEEMEKMLPHMRKTEICERKRSPVSMIIKVDEKEISNKTYKPAGLWEDGKSMGIERFDVKPGAHKITIEINDSLKNDWKYKTEKELNFLEGTRNVLVFNRGFNWFLHKKDKE